MGRLEDLENENRLLREGARRRDDELHRVLFVKLDALTLDVAKLSAETQHHNKTATASLSGLHRQVTELQEVVCGEPGKEKDGMSARLADVEKFICEKTDNLSKSKWLALGAFLAALFALGKDLIFKGKP